MSFLKKVKAILASKLMPVLVNSLARFKTRINNCSATNLFYANILANT